MGALPDLASAGGDGPARPERAVAPDDHVGAEPLGAAVRQGVGDEGMVGGQVVQPGVADLIPELLVRRHDRIQESAERRPNSSEAYPSRGTWDNCTDAPQALQTHRSAGLASMRSLSPAAVTAGVVGPGQRRRVR